MMIYEGPDESGRSVTTWAWQAALHGALFSVPGRNYSFPKPKALPSDPKKPTRLESSLGPSVTLSPG